MHKSKILIPEMSEPEEKIKLNLRRYKGHHRKFPWSLVIRIVTAFVALGIIIVLLKSLTDLKAKEADTLEEELFTIEIER